MRYINLFYLRTDINIWLRWSTLQSDRQSGSH